MDTGLICVNIAVLAIAQDPSTADLATVKIVADRLTAAGHHVVTREIVKDTEAAIRQQLTRWIADPNIDVVIATGGTESETAHTALGPLVTETVPGFTDLFRWLAFQEIGPGAMLSNAEAVQCGKTFVFVLPASVGAVGAAMDKLIVPQLDHRTKPRNLVMQMPRLRPPPPVGQVPARPIIPAIPPPPVKTAIPQPIASEKTVSGSGVVPKRLPAALETPVRVEMPRIVPPVLESPAVEPPRKLVVPGKPEVPEVAAKAPLRLRPVSRNVRPPDDPPTRPIDVAKLERQLALSAADQDAPTRPIDLAGLLPRVPPGADEFVDDDQDEPLLEPPALADPASRPRSNVVPRETFAIDAKPRAEVAIKPPAAPLARAAPSAAPANAEERARPSPSAPPAIAATIVIPPLAPPVAVPARPAQPAAAIANGPLGPPPLPALPAVRPEPSSSHTATSEQPRNPPPPPPSEPVRTEIIPAKPPIRHPVTTKVRPSPRPRGAIMDELPRGEFSYPERRRNTKKLVLVICALALAAAASFIAVVLLFPGARDPKSRPPEVAARAVEPTPVAVPAAPLDGPAPGSGAENHPSEIVIDTTAPADAAPSSPVEQAVRATPSSATHPSKRSAKSSATQVGDPTPAAEPPIALKPLDPVPAIPAPPGPATAPVAPDCDEVACVLEHYARPCCERYRPAEAGFTPRSSVPDEITRAMVLAGVQKAKPVVIACGEKIAAKGTVKLGVTVAADGHVEEVSVKETPDPALGECVASALRKALFGKSVNGGSFTYPFVF